MVILPVYDMLLLPDVVFNFKKDVLSRMPVSEYHEDEDVLFLIQKINKKKTELEPEDIQEKGLIGTIRHIDEDGDLEIHITNRVMVSDMEKEGNSFTATATIIREKDEVPQKEADKLCRELKDELLEFVKGFPWGVLARSMISRWNNISEVGCAMANYLDLSPEDKYAVMAEDSPRKRQEMIVESIREFLEFAKVSNEIEGKQKQSQEKAYRENAIRRQIELLQEELEQMHPEEETDIARFERLIEEAGMNEEAYREAKKALNRMKQDGQNGHEYGTLYDYLEFVTTLSWKKAVPEEIELKEAEAILHADHYGLDKVKDRILQQIAVMALNKQQSGSILLFVGAPGTGKTSIGQSIAKALHREYVRISLGGIRDEAEIRGHRRTYIGAMPGRIMEGMKRSGVSNPVVVLDEVDKLAKDYSGDPASALLEVLDPEQNFSFTDHYMNVPYVLSDVLFVCTANSLDTIPEPLLNRMEVIRFPGYTAVEKYSIAADYLLPAAMKKTGLKKSQFKITPDAIRKVISDYTAESGVRGLKKQMEALCRKAAVQIVRGDRKSVTVGVKKVEDFLDGKGIRHDHCMEQPVPGVVTGLAWTAAGGEILFIETLTTEGEGEILITGQLGDVMKESARIALSLVKSMFPEESQYLKGRTIHLHVPAGATPKDGPSAGITLVTALVSLIKGKGIDTHTAMTGEVSLRGGVMPIGGLPEKLMAAQRAGVRKVYIPSENVEDLSDVAEEVKKDLKIIPVKTVQEVLQGVGLLKLHSAENA